MHRSEYSNKSEVIDSYLTEKKNHQKSTNKNQKLQISKKKIEFLS